MAVTEQEVRQGEKRMAALRENGFAVSARYDRRTARIVVNLNTGVQIAFPARLAEGLAEASPDDLAEIEISPAGLGLHWPKLDADVYVSALLTACSAQSAGWPCNSEQPAAKSVHEPRPLRRARTAAGAGDRARRLTGFNAPSPIGPVDKRMARPSRLPPFEIGSVSRRNAPVSGWFGSPGPRGRRRSRPLLVQPAPFQPIGGKRVGPDWRPLIALDEK
jgi:uncharacterized protein DUF2442